MDSGQSMKQIGIVGLGLVGTALSRILMEKGQRVIGFDISEQAMEAAEAIGVVPAPSLHHVAETCSLLFLCLPNSDVVKDVMYGAARPVQAGRGQLTHDSTKQHRPSGLAAWCTPGHIICDMTTGHPCDMIQLAHELRARSVGYLEVMVGGSSEQLREQRAMLIIGGDQGVFNRIKGILDLISNQIYYMGSAGAGIYTKLVFNLVLGLNRAVLAEGLNFGKRLDLDPARLLDVLKAGATYSGVMDTKGGKMIKGDFTPVARLHQHRKDVGLMLDLARDIGTRLPLSHAHADLLTQGIALGLGDLDNAAVFKVYEQLSDGDNT